MRKREFETSGKINNRGQLVMFMGEVNEFFKLWPNAKIVCRFFVSQSGASEALKGYYFNFVVPTFKRAIWESGERKTEEQTERFLREISPIMYEQVPDIDTGNYSTRIKEIRELSNPELIEHIDHLKQIAAEEYGCFIDDPRSF